MRRLMAALLTGWAAVAHGGLTMTAVTKMDESRNGTQTVTMMAEGDRARIEFQGKSAGGTPPGGYLLTTDGGSTMYMVNPKERSYIVWDMEKMAALAGGVMQGAGGMFSMKVSNHKSEKLLDEKGPALMGYPTRHYKFKTSYNMETAVFGMRNVMAISREDEMWTTTKIAEKGLLAWRKQQKIRTGNADLDKLIDAEMGKVEGVPLKQVSLTTTTTEGKGAPQTTKMTMEVTEIKEGKLAADLLQLPAGYKEEKMEIPPEMQQGGTAGAGASRPGSSPAGFKIPPIKLPFGR